ncbi:MAG: NAD+ synthase [Planctomycetota bacterium]
MRLTLAQLDPTVGDVAGNTALVLEAIERARADGADVLVTSELALLGYPPRDLLLRDGVVETCEAAVQRIAEAAGDLVVVVGHPRRAAAGERPCHNSVSVCRASRIEAVYDKQLLPGYDVFDEDRYFEPGAATCVVEIAGRRVGVVVCEDLWEARDAGLDRDYGAAPVAEVVRAGCDVVLSLNASPFVIGKGARHVRQARAVARRHGVALAVVNQVGGNDDLVFDGRSILVDAGGGVVATLPAFEPAVRTVELPASRVATTAAAPPAAPTDWRAETYAALVLGVRDYCGKTGHERVLVGLSGGIDSAVTAVVAAAALGPDGVRGVMLPSRFSSDGARRDAVALARALGMAPLDELSIEALHDAARQALDPALGGGAGGVVDENVQARLRGLLLMALSNATGTLLMATSNKSELAVGYSTLYGDMCGAVSVIGDLTKGRVYALAEWINEHATGLGFAGPPIPRSSIDKPPSAELRPDQTDQDTLPPYDALDAIVEGFVERDESVEAIVATTGLDEALVRRWTEAIDRAQYKRDQAAVILKVTPRAFGRGRPMPIVLRTTVVTPDRPPADDARPGARGQPVERAADP